MKTFTDYRIDIPAGASGHMRVLCPECSQNRQKSGEKCLAVDVQKGVWYCHHCHWSGGLHDEPKDDPLAKEYAKPKYRASTNLPPNVIEWFVKRGIPENILALNRIGYGPSFGEKNGIQFPYFKDGQLVNIKHRTHDKQFRQEKNAEKCLYRFDAISQDESGALIITEGEIDALSIQAAGHNNVCSIPDGAPSADSKSFATKFDFLKSAEEILSRCSKVILATDNDGPGLVAERELARRIGVEKCYRIQYPDGCKDANDVLVKHGGAALYNLITNAIPYPVEGIISPIDLTHDMLSVYDKGFERGVSTGIIDIDPFYTVKPCEFTVVTGIPGSGKSNFVDAIMVNLSQMYGWTFGVFSPENWPVERHLQTLLEKLINRPFAKDGFFTQRMTRDDVKSNLAVIDRHFKFIVPKDELLSVDTILEKARVLIFRHGINGLVIDPWNELEHLYGKLTETQYISEQLTRIRRFARMNRIHIWIVAHPRNLSKDADGNYKPPTMYEISGGANWRNKADNGICVHRPDYQTDETEILIQKIRFKEIGKIGKATIKYCRDTGNYS